MTNLTQWTKVLALILLAASLAVLSCDDGGEGGGNLEPPDFFVTVKLHTGFFPLAVDRLEVVIYDSSKHLSESEGQARGGGISWEMRDGPLGDEFAVNMTSDYFLENAVEVAADTWEIDIPFIGGGEEAGFNVQAAVYWTDPDGDEQQIGFGTGILELPMERQGSGITVEVECRSGWDWTCRTGCDNSAQTCDNVEECGSGFWDCIDGCCISQ